MSAPRATVAQAPWQSDAREASPNQSGAAKLIASPTAGLGLRITSLAMRLASTPAPARLRLLADEIGGTVAAAACNEIGLEGGSPVGMAIEMAFGVAFGLALSKLDLDVTSAFAASMLGTVAGRQLGRWGSQAASAARARRLGPSSSSLALPEEALLSAISAAPQAADLITLILSLAMVQLNHPTRT